MTSSNRLKERLRADPVFFVEQILGGRPWEKQREILESVRDHSRTTVRSASDVGKSWTAAAMWFLYCHPNSIVVVTSPTFRQIKDIIFREVSALYRSSRYPLGSELSQVNLNLGPKHFMVGYATTEAEQFTGIHADAVMAVGDEASGIDQSIFEAIENPLSSGFTSELLISNPTQLSGTFYNSFKSSLYHPIHISAFDSPNLQGVTIDDIRSGEWRSKVPERLPAPYLISPQAVWERHVEWGEDSPLWQSYVLGQFPIEGTDTLIPLFWALAAQDRAVEDDGMVAVGVDVARYGDDSSVLVKRRGGRVETIVEWGKTDTMETVGRIIANLEGGEVIYVDVVGVGGGVVDRLAEEKYKVVAVNVGEKADDPSKFSNKRAEIFWNLRQRFQEGSIPIPANSKLVAQLTAIKYSYNSKGQLVLESKDSMKKRGLKSPDLAAMHWLWPGLSGSQSVMLSITQTDGLLS